MEEINVSENIKHPLEKLGNFWVRFDDSNPTISNIYQKKTRVYKIQNRTSRSLCGISQEGKRVKEN